MQESIKADGSTVSVHGELTQSLQELQVMVSNQQDLLHRVDMDSLITLEVSSKATSQWVQAINSHSNQSAVNSLQPIRHPLKEQLRETLTYPFDELEKAEFEAEIKKEATRYAEGSFLILEEDSQKYAMNKKERYEKVLDWWEVQNPHPHSELNYTNNFELLVAVILSAQCTDARVNMVTPELLRAYPTAEKMAQGEIFEIYEYIKTVSYPNAKAEHLWKMANELVNRFGGEVPNQTEDLMSLPGVGRKTANVMQVEVFGKPAMPVDTHVFRVANRIGLTNNSKTPLETETELTKNIPQDKLSRSHHWLVLHGRYICTAINPKCDKCGISAYCKDYERTHKAQNKKIYT